MRISHIEYLKSLILSVKVLPEPPATEPVSLFSESRIFQTSPNVDDYPSLFPFCVLIQSPLVSIADGKRFQKLEPETISGVKNIRFLKRHYIQEFTYTIHFWMQNSAKDVPSAGHLGSGVGSLGIIDQILNYLSNHRKFATAQGITVEVKPGASFVVSDSSENLGYYKLKMEIVFSDGLFETESVPTLAQGTFQIEEPTEIGTSEEQ
ncbi:LIC10173 family protein [Leptospira kmetyi]|uniref:LIC10173 family protein n=1 Tax=Leptospira kmetyi TaxID=408139 RepID=UPI003EBD1950